MFVGTATPGDLNIVHWINPTENPPASDIASTAYVDSQDDAHLAEAKAYTDEVVTVATADPTGIIPTRDGLLWVKVVP